MERVDTCYCTQRAKVQLPQIASTIVGSHGYTKPTSVKRQVGRVHVDFSTVEIIENLF